jgi:hypothetical protein
MSEPTVSRGKQRVLAGISPIAEAIADLQTIDPKWRVEIGVSTDSPEWIRGTDFTRASEGPFNSLLRSPAPGMLILLNKISQGSPAWGKCSCSITLRSSLTFSVPRKLTASVFIC